MLYCSAAHKLAVQVYQLHGHVQVGLLDIDICGPSIPRMLGLEGEEIHSSAAGWSPVYVTDNLGVMSIGFLLPSRDDAVIWRGPRKNGLIKQFLKVWQLSEMQVHACAIIRDKQPGGNAHRLPAAQQG